MGACRIRLGTTLTRTLAAWKPRCSHRSLAGDHGRANMSLTPEGSSPAVRNRTTGMSALAHKGARRADSSSAATARMLSSTLSNSNCRSQ